MGRSPGGRLSVAVVQRKIVASLVIRAVCERAMCLTVSITWAVVMPVKAAQAPDTPANRTSLFAANAIGSKRGSVEVDDGVRVDGDFHYFGSFKSWASGIK